jgi:hypothetical protein
LIQAGAPTGADLPSSFLGHRLDLMYLERTYGAVGLPLEAQRLTYHEHGNPTPSATLAFHTWGSISPWWHLAGMATSGTGSEAAPWAGVSLAARARLTMTESEPFPLAGGSVVNSFVFTARDLARGAAEIERPAAADVGAADLIRYLVTALIGLGPTERAERGSQETEAGEPSLGAGNGHDARSSLEMEAMARGMTAVPAAIAVPPPEVPELGESALENVKTLFGLTASELARLFGVTERQMRRYLADGNLPGGRQRLADALMAVGLTVIGGLGTAGARDWLYGGEPSAAELAEQGRIDELASRADELRDSPFT